MTERPLIAVMVALFLPVGIPVDGQEAAVEPVTDPAMPSPESPTVIAPPGAENAPTVDEMDMVLTTRVQRGLEYLVQQQQENGSFGRGRYANHVAITALAGIAFMAAVLTLELVLSCESDAHERNASWGRWSDRRVVRVLEIWNRGV